MDWESAYGLGVGLWVGGLLGGLSFWRCELAPHFVDHPMDDFSLKHFTALNALSDISAYVQMLKGFDAIQQMRDLKAIARERAALVPGSAVRDVGCGFGLETLRLAEVVVPGGWVAGLDQSEAFIDEAKSRAVAAGLEIDYRLGQAEALPYENGSFDYVRAERLLVYL